MNNINPIGSIHDITKSAHIVAEISQKQGYEAENEHCAKKSRKKFSDAEPLG
jgi:hypothetical protein